MKAVRGVFITKIVDFAVRFGTSVLLARWLGPSDRGVLTFTMLVITWVVMLGGLGFTDATIYLVGSGRVLAPSAVGMLTVLSVGLGILYAAGAWVAIRYHWVAWPAGEPNLFLLMLALAPMNLLASNWLAVLQGLRRYTAYNGFMVTKSLMALMGVLIGICFWEARLMGIGMAMVASGFVTLVMLAVYCGRLIEWRPVWSALFLKEGWKYGVRTQLSVICASMTMRLDQLALGALLPPEHLGWYSIAVGISELPQLLPDSIGVVLLPQVAKDPVAGGPLTARVCRGTTVIMLAVSLGMAISAPVAIPLVYGKTFQPAVPVVFYLLPSVVCLSMSKVLTKYIGGMGWPSYWILSTITGAAITLVMIVPMVRHWGIAGAALTSSCAYAAEMIVNLFFTKRLSGLGFAEFLKPSRADFEWLIPSRLLLYFRSQNATT
jgi:O-antigen/teichoic acid export membrane protein